MNFRPNPLLYGAHEDFLSSFKLVVTMRDEVDHDLLLEAVNSAVKRYPYFCVSPQINGESIQLQFNEAPIPVFKDGRCVVLGTKESNWHLLVFGCEGRRIFLHASHYIADGMGISPMLMSLLYLYISEKYGTDGLNSERILMPDDAISDDEYAYPFPEEPVSTNNAQIWEKTLDPAYSLDVTAFDKQGLYAYHLRIPQIAMMDVANPSDGSPVSFLSVMLFRALCALDKGIERPVIAHVQHQYRAAINAPLNRHSLVSYIPVELSPIIKERRVELQNTIIRGQIILGSEPENDLRSVDRLVSVFSKDKCLSIAEKQTYVTTSGGPIFADFGYEYIKALCKNFYGISQTKAYRATNLDVNMIAAEDVLTKADISVVE